MATVAGVADTDRGFSWKRMAWRVRALPIIPALILAAVVIMAVFAPWLAPHDPATMDLPKKLIPPFQEQTYWLGTDHMGRDVLSRVIFGARISLLVGFLSIGLAGAIGCALGLAAGYLGGRWDTAIMTVVNVQMSVPALVLAVLLAAVIGVGLLNIIIVIGIIYWTFYARIVRGEAMAIKGLDYVVMAGINGCGPVRIMFTHVLPNLVPSIIVMATLQLGTAIIAEAALSFLGLGVQPPDAAWGLMLADGRLYITKAFWLAFFPGLAITVTVLGANLLGDWLRDTLDPKRRQV